MRKGFIFSAIIAAGIAFFAGTFAEAYLERIKWKGEAVRHHAAHYDSQTAEFIWNDEQPKGKE